MKTSRARTRSIVRWLLLAVAAACAWPMRPEAWSGTSVVLPALSPFVAAGGALAARTAGVLTLLALPAVVLAWFLPRWLCRWTCPVGLLQETLTRACSRGRHPARRFPPLGPAIAVATLAGAALGYPLFLWLDPFAIFNSGLNAWRLPWLSASVLLGLGLPALLVLELALPQVWCQRLCPLGATQDGLTRLRRWLARWQARRTPLEGGVGRAAAGWPARRTFLAACIGAGGAWAARAVRAQPPPLRPPGTLPEESFGGVCVRCGNCGNVCPSRIIQPDLAGRPAAWLAPRLSFAEDYCREDCHRCHQVCPSGAIRRLSLAEKRRALIGFARVDSDTCLMVLGQECNACVQRCPYEAIAIGSAADGFASRPIVDAAKCNGCGACEAACPVQPVRAVRVVPAGDQRT